MLSFDRARCEGGETIEINPDRLHCQSCEQTMNSHSRSPAADSDGNQPGFALTLHAEQMPKARGMKKLDVSKALSTGSFHVDSQTGHEVFRFGDLRVVVKREGDRLLVLTASRVGDFAEHAG